MKRLDLNALSDEELIRRFTLAARTMGSSVLDSETRQANRMYNLMRAIDTVLRLRGKNARLKLMPLLDDSDRFVRYYAAKKLLGLVPGRARAVIEWNANYWFDAIAGDAGMTLDDLDAGFYKPD
jgi:hypothetical protein